jgi:branched-chain amino acid transport system permease protein
MAEVLAHGVLMGGVYGLVALGLSLITGVSKIINIAHGALLMVAMYLTYWLWTLGVPPYASLLPVVVVLFALGYLIQGGLIAHVLRGERAQEPVSVLLITLGLMIVIENASLALFGPNYFAFQDPAPASLRLFGIFVPQSRLIAFLVAAGVTYGVHLLITRTDLGLAIRAVGQDKQAARVMGIDDLRIYNVSFGLSCALVAVAGGVLLPFYPAFHNVGWVFLLRAFVITALGGSGNLQGAFWGGIVVGVVENALSQFISIPYATAAMFLLFILILLVRPTGLLRGID